MVVQPHALPGSGVENELRTSTPCTGPLAGVPMNKVTPTGPATPGAPQWMCAAKTFEILATMMM